MLNFKNPKDNPRYQLNNFYIKMLNIQEKRAKDNKAHLLGITNFVLNQNNKKVFYLKQQGHRKILNQV